MPNIRILAKAVLQIFCSQGFSYRVEKGAQLQNDKTGGGKKIWDRLFFMYMPHIYILDSSISSSRFSQLASVTDRQTEGRTDGRTDRPKLICPLNFSEVGA